MKDQIRMADFDHPRVQKKALGLFYHRVAARVAEPRAVSTEGESCDIRQPYSPH